MRCLTSTPKISTPRPLTPTPETNVHQTATRSWETHQETRLSTQFVLTSASRPDATWCAIRRAGCTGSFVGLVHSLSYWCRDPIGSEKNIVKVECVSFRRLVRIGHDVTVSTNERKLPARSQDDNLGVDAGRKRHVLPYFPFNATVLFLDLLLKRCASAYFHNFFRFQENSAENVCILTRCTNKYAVIHCYFINIIV